MENATYETIDDPEPFYGEVPELHGVWATGKTLEECQKNLLSALEDWIADHLEWELDDLAQLCFSERKSKDNLHSDLLLKLQLFLNKKGYNVIREYPIKFNTMRRRDHKKYVRPGYIDIYAERMNKSFIFFTSKNETKSSPSSKIAIEFDSGNLLKYKSIEKLLQSGARTCLGIVRGDGKYTNLTLQNKERYLEIKNRYDSEIENFYLIIIHDNILCSLS